MPVNAPREGTNSNLLRLLHQLPHLVLEMAPFNGPVVLEEDGQPFLVGTYCWGVS